MIIDDDDPFRNMLRQALEAAGYEVLEARNGKEGILCYRTMPAELVITDILMPEQEGLQTIKELRAEFPAVKIVAISGGGAKGNLNFLQLAEIFGVKRTLWKPFDLEELLRAIDNVLNGSSQV